MNFITLISRILVGLLFIFSGLIKANDPLGFSYKLDEYFTVFGTPSLSSFSLLLSMLICILEIVLGIAVIAGTRIKATAWLLLLMILFFTFLTFFSAYFNKVTDCGCFGDAIKLTPWESFYKDLILLILILLIFARKNKIKSLVSEKAGNRLLLVTLLLSIGFTVWCYRHLPVKDFRPYAIGSNLIEKMTGIPDEVKFTYQLKNKNNGELKWFDTWPENWDQHWDYVTFDTVVTKKGVEPRIHDFTITDENGTNLAPEMLADSGFLFMLVAYDLNKSDKGVQPEVNQFASACEKSGIRFIGMTATSLAETDVFRHEVQAMYPYYLCDATALKTIIRSNPGLVLLQAGTVKAMWHYNDFPQYEEVKNKYGLVAKGLSE